MQSHGRPEDERPEADDEPIEEYAEYEEDDPNNPSHPDHDLSESMPYSSYRPPPKPWYARRWILLIVAIFTLTGLLLPYIRNLFVFP